jgi:uncharacterized protein YbjT (DUF2867 family)
VTGAAPAAGRQALVAGATGLIGRRLLALLAESGRYERIHALTRRSLEARSPVVEQEVDFAALEDAASRIGPVDDAFCALGTTIRQAGSRSAFRRVDHDYVVAFGRLAKALGARSLSVVSSLGADPRSRTFYLKVKGETEADLRSLGLPGLALFRPSLLRGPRDEFRLGEELGNAAMHLFGALIPARYKAVSDLQLARAMLAVAADGITGVRVIESDEIRRLGA